MDLVIFGPIAPMVLLALAMAHPLVLLVLCAPVLLFGLLGYHRVAPPPARRPPLTPDEHAETLRYIKAIGNPSLNDLWRALAIVAILGAGTVAVLAPLYYFAGYL
jgi:hypothetical protein